MQDTAQDADAAWRRNWAFLAGDDLQTSPEFDGTFCGLALPQQMIRNIYHDGQAAIWYGMGAALNSVALS